MQASLSRLQLSHVVNVVKIRTPSPLKIFRKGVKIFLGWSWFCLRTCHKPHDTKLLHINSTISLAQIQRAWCDAKLVWGRICYGWGLLHWYCPLPSLTCTCSALLCPKMPLPSLASPPVKPSQPCVFQHKVTCANQDGDWISYWQLEYMFVLALPVLK